MRGTHRSDDDGHGFALEGTYVPAKQKENCKAQSESQKMYVAPVQTAPS